MAQDRLQKLLARAGVASRRKAEEYIAAGRVRVDGVVVTELGAKADLSKNKIELDGRPLHAERFCYGVFHKPRGMLTSLSDPEGRPTAADALQPLGVRVVFVGRLDFNTSGALLFTNDGDFAQTLAHARGNAPKVYAAKVQRRPTEEELEKWRGSIEIEGKKTRPAHVRILRQDGDKTWLEVTLHEGRKHQVRLLGDHAGTPVVRLARLSHAGINTEGLRSGHYRLLTIDELKSLKQHYGVPEKIRGAMEEAHREAAPKRKPRSSAKPKLVRAISKSSGKSSGKKAGSRLADAASQPERQVAPSASRANAAAPGRARPGARTAAGRSSSRGSAQATGEAASRSRRGPGSSPRPKTRS